MKDSLNSIIYKYLSTNTIDDDTELTNTLDSLLLVEMVTEIEDEYGIEFELEDLTPENLKSVKTLSDLVESKIT